MWVNHDEGTTAAEAPAVAVLRTMPARRILCAPHNYMRCITALLGIKACGFMQADRTARIILSVASRYC